MPDVSKVMIFSAVAVLAALTGIFLILRGPRIISLLIFKYLRRRRIAWVSLAAVMLCTTMVLVVISVMGGWLDMFEKNAKGLTGDVVIRANSLSGFAHYETLIAEIEKDPTVVAAVPIIKTFGLANIYGRHTKPVEVNGIPIDKIGRVNAWPQSLWQQHKRLQEMLEDKKLPAAERSAIEAKLKESPRFDLHAVTNAFVSELPEEVKADPKTGRVTGEQPVLQKLRFNKLERQLEFSGAMTDEERDQLKNLSASRTWGRAIDRLARESRWPGMIAGSQLLQIQRDATGQIQGRQAWKYTDLWIKLTVLGVGANQEFDAQNKAETTYWVVDDSRTGMFQYDSNSVYVPFERAQSDLGMGGSEAIDRDGNKVNIPARTTEVHVRFKDGQDEEAGKKRVEAIVDKMWAEMPVGEDPPRVETWRKVSELFIGAIQKEKMLVTFLFGIISVVAIFLIFCIFYMIVAEKTRDIGIIKSVGATGQGVAGIFLGYGLLIGLVGTGMGLLVSFLIVHNINEIHDWLGRALKLRIWSPEVYAFDTIPNTMIPGETAVIMGIAVLASVLGALVPAIRAARMHPVEALRWE